MFREDAEYISRQLNDAEKMSETAFEIAASVADALGERGDATAQIVANARITRAEALMMRAMVAHGRASLICMMETTKRGSGPDKPWIDVLNIAGTQENA